MMKRKLQNSFRLSEECHICLQLHTWFRLKLISHESKNILEGASFVHVAKGNTNFKKKQLEEYQIHSNSIRF